MKLHGIFVATTTPFDHNGAIYNVKVQHNVEKWNRTSVTGYVVASATGEGALLAQDEKSALWELTAKSADPEKILIAASGAEGVQECVRLTCQAANLGYHAALIEAPRRYDRPESLRIYFRAVADRAALPVIAAGVEPRFSAELFQHPNIVAVVDGDPAAGPVLASSAANLWTSLQAGVSGAILAFANAAPYATIAIWEAHRMREEEAGRDWQARIAAPAELVSGDYGLPALKHAMDLNGYYGGPPRLPLSVPTTEMRRRVEEAFIDLRG